jgi:CRISPR-associated protein Cas1
VSGKVASQRALLLRYLRRSSIPNVFGATEAMLELRRQLARTTTREQTMGVEGAAAAAYFGALAHLVPAWTGFQRRQRRPPKDPFNSALSYSYAILLAEVVAAISTVGLDPAAGLLHGDHETRPSLALDLMEEFRPLVVDAAVLNLFRRNALNEEMFVAEPDGRVSLTGDGRRRLVAGVEERLLTVYSHVPSGKRVSYRRSMLLQAQQLARVVEGRQEVYEPVVWR